MDLIRNSALDPLPHGVVGHAVLAAGRHEAHRRDILDQLLIRRALNLPPRQLWIAPAGRVPHAAVLRAVPLPPRPGPEGGSASCAVTRTQPVLPSEWVSSVAAQFGQTMRRFSSRLSSPT